MEIIVENFKVAYWLKDLPLNGEISKVDSIPHSCRRFVCDTNFGKQNCQIALNA